MSYEVARAAARALPLLQIALEAKRAEIDALELALATLEADASCSICRAVAVGTRWCRDCGAVEQRCESCGGLRAVDEAVWRHVRSVHGAPPEQGDMKSWIRNNTRRSLRWSRVLVDAPPGALTIREVARRCGRGKEWVSYRIAAGETRAIWASRDGARPGWLIAPSELAGLGLTPEMEPTNGR